MVSWVPVCCSYDMDVVSVVSWVPVCCSYGTDMVSVVLLELDFLGAVRLAVV